MNYLVAFARMRPINPELPCRTRTEALNVLGLRFRIARVATGPFPRIDSLERLLGAREPSFFHPAGMAHEAARKQFAVAPIESPRQGVDQSRLADIGVDLCKVACDLPSRRCKGTTVPRQHFGSVGALPLPVLSNRLLAIIQQRPVSICQHS